MEKYVVLDKKVGETPLSCAEEWRAKHPAYADVSLAYAGRLDPMASGKLLVLIGDECKKQTGYHGLDKEYEFSVLLGIGSDTHDVLGRLFTLKDKKLDKLPPSSDALQYPNPNLTSSEDELSSSAYDTTQSLTGTISLPFPLFSAKTIKGKPLHMWTLENRLHEIEIPTQTSEIYELELTKTETISRDKMATNALAKINTIPPVTELRKALGNDFRRVDVRQDWESIRQDNTQPDAYAILHFRCVASSGTYMRSLAHVIGQKLNTFGLAWHIHRTKIGIYNKSSKTWSTNY